MIGIVLGAALGAIVLILLGALGYRAARQRRVASSLVLGDPSAIAESRFVTAGGIDQWLSIRGHDTANPILLILPGSGLTLEPFTPRLRAFERHFTVAVWDRRDVGRTRARNGSAGNENWTFGQLADDGVDIVEHLRTRLGQDKVILLGHSQGTIVGTLMARRRPDLFHAYVGIGQVADMSRNEPASHKLALDRAHGAGNAKAVAALTRLTPPYSDVRTWIGKQRWSMITDPEFDTWRQSAMREVLTWPEFTLRQVYQSANGANFLPSGLFAETMACTPQWLGTTFEIPFFVLHGDADVHTIPGLAAEYLSAVQAPVKEFVPLPGSGHMVLVTRPDLVLTELLDRIRPLATAR